MYRGGISSCIRWWDLPYDYAVAVCNGFAKLCVRGTSVIFSSGDSGVSVVGIA